MFIQSIKASCREFLSIKPVFLEVQELCDIRYYVQEFKKMSKEELLCEKSFLDQKEAQESFIQDEVHLLERWLVEVNLHTERAELSKDALVDYYFSLFHKSPDPNKFHVDHPLVVQSRLVKSYKDL